MKKFLFSLLLIVGMVITILTTSVFAATNMSSSWQVNDSNRPKHTTFTNTTVPQYMLTNGYDLVLKANRVSGDWDHYYLFKSSQIDLTKTVWNPSTSDSKSLRIFPKNGMTLDYASTSIQKPDYTTSQSWTVNTGVTSFGLSYQGSGNSYNLLPVYFPYDIYNVDANLVYDSPADISLTDLENYNFTGLLFAKPTDEQLINDNVLEIVGKVKINSPNLEWGANGTAISEKKKEVLDYFVNNLKFNLDGQIVSPKVENSYFTKIDSGSISDFTVLPNVGYQFTFKTTLKLQNVSLPHNLKMSSKFITGFSGMLWWIEPTIVSYDDSVSFNINFVDMDDDGIDDLTGSGGGSSFGQGASNEGKPDKSDYDDDILGNLAYYWDSFLFYVTMPFELLGKALVTLYKYVNDGFTWVGNFSDFINTIFGFLPADVRGLIVVVFSVMILVTVINMFKGAK